ncbi:GNAT family N-acetyltransferase [Ensifer adhaerens]|uniref:GNAT family N-acetyltransferase n=1 Tax=Ensifer adhaerens TaxID=106592 RepID=UPI00132EDA22|nr:GNAT family N-acetyltransferase [Ensifer adhaerens]QHG73087.1 GNAT family N-acetyltransferase [Ensifer adhaerens]
MDLRKATIEDAKLLFDWRNDQRTREMSRETLELAWENHVSWLATRLQRDDHGVYIAEINGVPVGTIRIDHDEISYTVAPEQRRKGVGEAMLLEAKKAFGQKVAEVKRENMASVKIAERAGHIVKFID